MKHELHSRIERTLDRVNSLASGRLLAKQITYIIDSAITTVFQSLDIDQDKEKLCLIAIGGYGRMELAPRSDIDLLYLHDNLDHSLLEKVISKINNFLYDSGLEVGHSCRTIQESWDYLNHFQTYHAILDSRYLIGSMNLYKRYETEFLHKLPSEIVSDFNQAKLNSLEKSIYSSHTPLLLTEPDIKNGALGLRDIQFLYWIEKSYHGLEVDSQNGIIDFFTKGESLPIILAYDFFLKTRIMLHKITKKKTDRIELSLQSELAVELGFGERGLESVEEFVATFYKYQMDVLHYIGLFIDSKKLKSNYGEMEEVEYMTLPLARKESYLYPSIIQKIFTQPDNLYKDVITVFLACQDWDLDPSPTLLNELRFASHFLDEDFKNNKIAIELFLQLLKENRAVGKILTFMHRANVLGKFIPEFGACTNFPLFSYHHEYPVDEHTLLILRELDILVQGQFPDREVQEVFNTCENVHILYLALLVHDAGKVKEGDHCQYGAELSIAISRRLGLTQEEEDLFQFLVAHHIDMSEISTKRDIFDPDLIQEFAGIVFNKQRLALLYVLTIIDTKSVGPHILTNWKKDILYKLYISTHQYLNSETSTSQIRDSLISQLRNYLITKENFSEQVAEGLTYFAKKVMPKSYLNSNTFRRIVFHFTQFQIIKQNDLALKIEFEKEPSFLTLSVYSRYRNDILVHISSTVSSLNLNLIGMQPYRYTDEEDDFLITQVQITDHIGSGNIPSNTIEILQTQLENTFSGKQNPEENKPSIPNYWSFKQDVPAGLVEEMISFNNNDSDEFTILEIRLPDSIGLLYKILRSLYRKKYEIIFARISTSADFAYDTFYLKNHIGSKITDKKEMDDLRDELMMASREKEKDPTGIQEIYF
ncbi:MAG: hypothetical protein JJT78_11450 [Leptospira sp.]|nr:hypothetical protein [Leptospira sp.]